MYLYWFVNLQPNALCKVTASDHPMQGQIVRFKETEYYMQIPSYVFDSERHERVFFNCDSQFRVLPYKESLKFLIDLALGTKDREWFEELVHQYLYESQ